MDSKYSPQYQAEPAAQPGAALSGRHLARDADYLIHSFLPPAAHSPPPNAPSGLPLPFCIPQIAANFDSPFARGYSPVLQTSVGISQEELLSFIDGLNLCISSSPPLRVVDFAGLVIGFIPYHWAMIAGTLMQTVAQGGMLVLSKTLTDRYLREANRRIFQPRGLSARLCTTAAMQHLAMHKDTGGGPSTLDKIGRGVGTILLNAPIPFASRIVRAVADRPPKVPPSISTVGDGKEMPLATQRRLASLDSYALPLELHVPPPAKAQGIMDTMSSWGVAVDAKLARRKETKIEKRRRELARIEQQLQQLGIAPPGRQERKELRRAARLARERERGGGLISGLIGPKETKLERHVANADLLEHWASDKVLWVVIMNSELDKEIEGIERAESWDNEEHADEKTWRAEILRERDVLEEELDSDDADDEKGHYKQ
ncbi:hypothetical protein FB451DRAFT_1046222 [Mycena latifolia]|nr:hypothetical protein FB451DRAFT_1046222 [Mycena latifolia]